MRKQLDNYEVICPYPYLIRIGTNLKGHGFLTMAMCCFRDTACMYQPTRVLSQLSALPELR